MHLKKVDYVRAKVSAVDPAVEFAGRADLVEDVIAVSDEVRRFALQIVLLVLQIRQCLRRLVDASLLLRVREVARQKIVRQQADLITEDGLEISQSSSAEIELLVK